MKRKINKILVIAAHPDDEVLGCGGIIKKHSNAGGKVFVLFLTNGSTIRYGKKMKKVLQNNAKECAKALGVQEIYFKDLPEQELDNIPLINIVKEIERIIEKVKPGIIYTHYKGDINQDHKAVSQATLIAARPKNQHVKEIYSYELLSSTEWSAPFQENIFMPNVFVDITKEIQEKIKAFKKYQSQIEKWPHPRSIEGIEVLARYRGMQANLLFAEAFLLIRKINK